MAGNRSKLTSLTTDGRSNGNDDSLLSMEPNLGLPSDNIIINEVLCFLKNQVDTGCPVDDIIAVVSVWSSFSDQELEFAKSLAYSYVPNFPDRNRTKKRIGDNKRKNIVEDIIILLHHKMFSELENPPVFVARDLSKLPPISTSSTDITVLLRQIQKCQREILELQGSVIRKDDLQHELDQLPPKRKSYSMITRQNVPGVPTAPSISQPATGEQPPRAPVLQQPTLPAPTNDNSSTDKWTRVEKKPRARKMVIGKGDGGDRLKAATSRPFKIFVTRCEAETTCEDIMEWVKHTTKIEVECERLKTKYQSYSSFVITCHGSDQRGELLDPETWPANILVKPFYQSSSRAHVRATSTTTQRVRGASVSSSTSTAT